MSRLYIAIGLPVLGLAFSVSGCALLSQGSADQAEWIRQQQLRAAAEATPVDPKPQTVEEKLHRGDALRRDGAYAAAMWTYLQAHELDPDHPEPTARMGSLHLLNRKNRIDHRMKLAPFQQGPEALFKLLGDGDLFRQGPRSQP